MSATVDDIRPRRRRRRRRLLARYIERVRRNLGLFTLVVLLAAVLAVASYELGKSLLLPSDPCVDCEPPRDVGDP